MLRSTKALFGYRLDAADDVMGTVKDFLFDDQKWTIRWMVADTGEWLPKRKVLISPIMLGQPDWNVRLFPVRLTKNEIENAAGMASDEPVSRAYEKEQFDQYGWPYYWIDAGLGGFISTPTDQFSPQEKAVSPEAPILPKEEPASVPESPEAGASELRSLQEVNGYHIHAVDDEVGHVEDFIMDDESWTLRYMVVDTRNWLPGRKVLVSPDWVDAIHWADQQVTVKLTRDVIKGSPDYQPSTPINRAYEQRLHAYYGRSSYG